MMSMWKELDAYLNENISKTREPQNNVDGSGSADCE